MADPIELLKRPLVDGPLTLKRPLKVQTSSTAERVGGIATVASGDTTVVVSTTLVTSDSVVLTSLITPVASHKDNVTSVLSITDGTNFTVQAAKATVGSLKVGYLIVNPS